MVMGLFDYVEFVAAFSQHRVNHLTGVMCVILIHNLMLAAIAEQ